MSTFRLHSFWPIWTTSIHCNPILDICNLKALPPEADHSNWYLKLVLDCLFHLINQFIDHILDCLITWTTDQKSQGNFDPGTSVWKQICNFMFQLVSNLIQFLIEESRFRLIKRNATLTCSFTPLSPKSWSNANFSFQFIASYVWYSMENLPGDILG